MFLSKEGLYNLGQFSERNIIRRFTFFQRLKTLVKLIILMKVNLTLSISVGREIGHVFL